MKRSGKSIALLLVLALVLAAAAPAAAADGAISTVFNDAWYGGLTGGLVAAAVLVFSDDPGDHLEWILYGAAGGVIAGAAIGLLDSSSTSALAEVSDGRFRIAMPTPLPTASAGADGRVSVGVRADLLRARF